MRTRFEWERRRESQSVKNPEVVILGRNGHHFRTKSSVTIPQVSEYLAEH